MDDLARLCVGLALVGDRRKFKNIPGIRKPILGLTPVDQPKDQDGFLRTIEVFGMKLNAGVAALTAC